MTVARGLFPHLNQKKRDTKPGIAEATNVKTVKSETLKSFNHCYGLNCGPSKFLCWSPNSSRHYTADTIFKEVMLNEVTRMKP